MTRARDLSNLIGSGNYVSETLTATAGQTAFTVTNGYTPNFVQVFMNGLLLDPVVDYAATTSPTITLTTAANAGDELEVVKYNTFSVGNAITQTAADTRYVNVSGDTMTGGLTIGDYTAGTELTVKRNASQGSNIGAYKQTGSDTIQMGPAITMQTVNPVYAVTQQVGANGELHTFNYSPSYGWNKRMTMDAAGRVTMPYQPLFRGVLNAHVSPNTSVSTPTKITSIGVRENIGGHWSTSTHSFTCPVAGQYLVSAFGIKYPVSGQVAHIDVYRNGVDIDARIRAEEESNYAQFGGSCIISCSAGDTLDWRYFGNAGIHSGNGQWTIKLIG